MDNANNRPPEADEEHHEVEEEEDDDDWSRRVETDDPPSEHMLLASPPPQAPVPVAAAAAAAPQQPPLAPQQRPEPTLKQKLVERERQKRLETERARLKRQFALQNNGHSSREDEDDDEDYHLASHADASVAVRAPESLQGTVGEDSTIVDPEGNSNTVVAATPERAPQHQPQPEQQDQQQQSVLTYPMERFLQDQGNPGTEASAPPPAPSQPQGVVMERFLNEPVVVDPREEHQRSVSFDVLPVEEGPPATRENPPPPPSTSIESNPSDHVASLPDDNEEEGPLQGESNVDGRDRDDLDPDGNLANTATDSTGDPEMAPHPPQTPEPRVLGLTEAEIQELASIEEASIGNAPPSEPGDLSESSFVGELLTDHFGPASGGGGDGIATLSQGTPTTAMESSVSIQSGGIATLSDHDAEEVEPEGDTDIHQGEPEHAHTVDTTSSIGGSVTAQPSSVVAEPDATETSMDMQPEMAEASLRTAEGPGMVVVVSETPPGGSSEDRRHRPIPTMVGSTSLSPQLAEEESDEGLLDLETIAAANHGVVNRQLRPGMIPGAPASPVRRVASVPDNMAFDVDGFDFDKNQPTTPDSAMRLADDSFMRSLTDTPWSPAGQMAVSPLHGESTRPQLVLPTTAAVAAGATTTSQYPTPANLVIRTPAVYGTSSDIHEMLNATGTPQLASNDQHGRGMLFNEKDQEAAHESQPLLPDIPPEIITNRRASSGRSSMMSSFLAGEHDLQWVIDEAISDIRSENTESQIEAEKEAELYLKSNTLARAFPERLIALTVTLLVEIPVLVMVSGGSDRLCILIGRSKYQLMMGFLPLSSAISGNVGLQASTLTTRAISHGHVTRETYKSWLFQEVGAAAYLGLGMGCLLGFIAFLLSDFEIPFGFTVMLAQFVSILTAGFTGTMAPLLFTFIFNRDAGKWGGPLETAIQDIIGSFAMVVMSYKILEAFGPLDVSPDDTCGMAE